MIYDDLCTWYLLRMCLVLNDTPRWTDEVEGFVADEEDKDGGQWKQLVYQDRPYLPPSKREILRWIVFFNHKSSHRCFLSKSEIVYSFRKFHFVSNLDP